MTPKRKAQAVELALHSAVIGTVDRRDAVLDTGAMLATHMALVASSGGGKSWLLRRILEQTFGLFPHIVIDVEGEMKTLRERYDYIIASADGDGDCLAHPRSAKLLARRLLELNASCIIDIYELRPDEKVAFVRDFLHALVNAPKKLWGPRLVVIDEAQEFCPEKAGRGQASKPAVIDLLSRGRKRGLSTILASQRLSKVSKDALGECRNKLYGFCNLLADRKRAMEDLGFVSKADQQLFQQLDTGQFYAVGPAISKREVIKIKVGKVQTTHPRPGDGIVVHTPPPKAKVRRLIGELQDLPEQAAQEVADLEGAKARIRELERSARKPRQLAVDQKALDKAHASGHAQATRQLAPEIKTLRTKLDKAAALLRDGADRLTKGAAAVAHAPASTPARTAPTPQSTPQVVASPPPPAAARSNGAVGSAKQRILDAVAWFNAIGVNPVSRDQVAFVAGYTPTGGTFQNYLGALRTAGLVDYPQGGVVALTGDGAAHANDPAITPTTEALHAAVLSKLPNAKQRILQAALSEYPNAIGRDGLAAAAGYEPTGGTFQNYLGALRTLGVITYPERGHVRAADFLFLD